MRTAPSTRRGSIKKHTSKSAIENFNEQELAEQQWFLIFKYVRILTKAKIYFEFKVFAYLNDCWTIFTTRSMVYLRHAFIYYSFIFNRGAFINLFPLILLTKSTINVTVIIFTIFNIGRNISKACCLLVLKSSYFFLYRRFYSSFQSKVAIVIHPC